MDGLISDLDITVISQTNQKIPDLILQRDGLPGSILDEAQGNQGFQNLRGTIDNVGGREIETTLPADAIGIDIVFGEGYSQSAVIGPTGVGTDDIKVDDSVIFIVWVTAHRRDA